VARGEVDATVNVETLQELLHRYRAIGRWSDGRRVYDLARTIFPAVVPITAAVLDEARRLLDRHPMLMARDGLHAAVVLVEGLEAICSYDRDFDLIPGVRRVEP
jgi:predicted nucleic acid-binding protein